MKGCTAKVALDPVVVLAFLDYHTAIDKASVPHRRRKLINDRPLGQGDQARLIRRWRTARFPTITEHAVKRLLKKFGLTLDDLTLWGLATQQQPYIRNQGAPTT